MSRLRPDLRDSWAPAITNGTAYLMIYEAVQAQRGLCHGKLHDRGEHCAIGSFFHVNPKPALPNSLIDEVAAVNDSVPHKTNAQRRDYVARWLKWKLTQLGMPGFRTKRSVADTQIALSKVG